MASPPHPSRSGILTSGSKLDSKKLSSGTTTYLHFTSFVLHPTFTQAPLFFFSFKLSFEKKSDSFDFDVVLKTSPYSPTECNTPRFIPFDPWLSLPPLIRLAGQLPYPSTKNNSSFLPPPDCGPDAIPPAFLNCLTLCPRPPHLYENFFTPSPSSILPPTFS